MPSTLITGANRGLGLEFARQYLADGWRVYAACRDPAAASGLHGLAKQADDKLRILAMDVTDPDSIHAAAAELDGQPIDLLLNNAGIIGPRGQIIGNIDYLAWAQVLAINTMGPMRVSEAFVEHVAQSDRKLIVTLTSGMGSIADNTSGGSIVYRSSKAAVNMVMRSLAIDLAPRGITCVVINPGWVQTDMGGTNATLEPSDSISRMRRVIATLGPKQSGKFFNHTGREYSW
jgi:NAD(P)-dependent dehydrogenase (short-subunit alcohol dehydrogenase family)